MLSRRMLFVGLVRTSHGSHGSHGSYGSQPAIDRWRESLSKYAHAEQLMSEAKKFYAELVYEPYVTDEAEDHFVKARSLTSTDAESVILQQMAIDVLDKRLFSNYLES